jgi:signal transduction histidine kinase
VPPGGVERRRRDDLRLERAAPTISIIPLWPFRLAVYAFAVSRAAAATNINNWTIWICTGVLGAYTSAVCLRPIPYRNDIRTRSLIGIEHAIVVAVAVLTDAWSSPFIWCLIPSTMLTAFACGTTFGLQIGAASSLVISMAHLTSDGIPEGFIDSAVGSSAVFVVAALCGFTHRLAVEAARQQQLTLARVNRLAEANSLLFSLTRVAQTLPASLDLNDVLDSTVNPMRAMVPYDTLVVLLLNPNTNQFEAARTHGIADVEPVDSSRLCAGLARALTAERTVHIDQLESGTSVAPHSSSGLYAALRARGALVGLLAIESNTPKAFTAQHAEIVHGLAEPFGIAVDNARMFRHIRTLAANEERSRIARDLHDRVGSSLAMIGFEVDRAKSVAANGGNVEPALAELRNHVRSVVVEVRDTLSDLRTDVTDERNLEAVARGFLDRFHQRTAIDVHFDAEIEGRLPLLHERELWQILREAMINVERHSRATVSHVVLRESDDAALLVVSDNGVGFDQSNANPDRYGLVGMRERASHLGATITIGSAESGGTEVRVTLQLEMV